MVIRLACNFDKWNFNLVCFGHHFERVYIYTPKCSQQEGVPVAFIAETHKAIIKTYTLGCSFLVSEKYHKGVDKIMEVSSLVQSTQHTLCSRTMPM